MRRGGVAVAVLLVARVVEAQPVADQTPSAAPTTSPSAPRTGVYDGARTRRTVDRSGVRFLGGFTIADGGAAERLDIYVPLHLSGAPRLAVGVVLGFDYTHDSIPEVIEATAYGFAIYPSVTYDWRLPITSGSGDFLALAEAGVGLGVLRLKIDEPFMPGRYQTLKAYAMRLAGAMQWHAHNGLVVSVQPLGLSIPLSTPEAPGPGWEVNSDLAYEFALLAGYQFR